MRPVPRSVRSLVVLAICAVSLAGCTGGEPDPTEYGTANSEGKGYYGNFMYGCTGVEPTDGDYDEATLESESFCRCVFEGLKEKVPFPEMKAFEEAQAEAEPGELTIPSNIDSVRKSCAPEARS